MANTDDISRPGGSDPSVPIVPIDFTPNQVGQRRLRLSLKPVHALVGVLLTVSAYAAWYILTAKSVFIEVEPFGAEIEISGGVVVPLGPRYLMHPGLYDLTLRSPGYHDTQTQLLITQDQAQTHPFTLKKLPGVITVTVLNQANARVQIDGVDVGITPVNDIDVEAGEHRFTVSKDRYLTQEQTITVEGRQLRETFEFELDPAWARVAISSEPAGADVLVDGELVGTTPIAAELLQGEREVTLKLAGYKAWQDSLVVEAAKDFAVPAVTLVPADGLAFIRSRPSDASVTIDGVFKGNTPLEVVLKPDERHEITLFKAGYESASHTVRAGPNEETTVNLDLQPVTAQVLIQADPADAELYIDGILRGRANQTLELLAVAQQIEIRKPGYVPYTTVFTSRPGLDQAIRVSLKSLEQARQEQIKPSITTVTGQTLNLFYPTAFTMGASRREAGRRPNEMLREIILTKPFYFSLTEVTNGQFKRFKKEHSSGTYQQQSLDGENQPVVRVTWDEAALYCNWLSAQESLPLFYQVANDKVVGFNPEATGYRLPSEAEWAWIARSRGDEEELRYSWGDQLPPPDKAGNFADRSTRAFLGAILPDYMDNYIGTAPVGQFTPNHHGVFDIAGNAAEWVQDFYGDVGNIGGAPEVDPLGPLAGQFHTIRGSSWAHGSVTELRLSFRDFGEEPRDDVGFRVARYLEE